MNVYKVYFVDKLYSCLLQNLNVFALCRIKILILNI